MLINAGANLFLTDENGKTALDHALFVDQMKTASILMKEEAFLKAEKHRANNGDNKEKIIAVQ
jgi:ankyrin repeat protein